MSYVSAIQDLLRDERLMPLGPGSPVSGYRAALAQPLEKLFTPATIVDRDAALACQAALWLSFDHFDESHAISQDLETVEGSYWHGILHRREPDYGNAKYWFRRVGRHSVFEPLRLAAAELAGAVADASPAAFLKRQTTWDPFAFIDLCESAARGRADEMLCRKVQQREWELLFEDCYRRAVEGAKSHRLTETSINA